MSKFSIDSKEFDEIIDRLIERENLNKVERRVLRQGLSEIRNQSKKSLLAKMPNASKRSSMYDDTLVDGVMQSIVDDGTELIGKVHVMGTRRATSGTYRLRFFEGGTKERLKKSSGARTGHIEALNFFSEAVSSSEISALTKMEEQWDREIKKMTE